MRASALLRLWPLSPRQPPLPWGSGAWGHHCKPVEPYSPRLTSQGFQGEVGVAQSRIKVREVVLGISRLRSPYKVSSGFRQKLHKKYPLNSKMLFWINRHLLSSTNLRVQSILRKHRMTKPLPPSPRLRKTDTYFVLLEGSYLVFQVLEDPVLFTEDAQFNL